MGKNSHTSEEVAKKILEIEDDLIAVTVLSTLGRGDLGAGYEQGSSGKELWEKVKNQVTENQLIPNHKQRILNFAQNSSDPLQRWDQLSRMLDGKRAMHRISYDCIGNNFSLKNERADLADVIYNNGLIDKRLSKWINSIA